MVEICAIRILNDSGRMSYFRWSSPTRILGYVGKVTRCDLHPRVSRSGGIVSIDTMDRGQRRTYAYRLVRG